MSLVIRVKNLDTFVKPLILVPENISISKVLVMMNKERSHTALVIDEYGGTAGNFNHGRYHGRNYR